MSSTWFTAADVRQQLAALGYDGIPEDIMQDFVSGEYHPQPAFDGDTLFLAFVSLFSHRQWLLQI